MELQIECRLAFSAGKTKYASREKAVHDGLKKRMTD
jgi:hypothetical protein